jgi:hypothetical protein
MPCSQRHVLGERLGLMFLCGAVELHAVNRFARLERAPKPFLS